MDRLQQLLEDGVIDEVYNQLKSGKEAEVWLVSHRGEPVAAKLYKAREFRSFKNDAGYKEGRQVRNTRTQRAMDKGSRFGRDAAEEAWKSAEADAMFALHAAGVRVPRPVLFYDGVLLMEVIGDAEGRVAPRLVDAAITREQAGPLYRQLRDEAIKMLCADLIHGDLSEFNVLLGASGPVIIDFPQVVTAAKNSRSEQFFRRDLGNLLRFFSSFDPSLQALAFEADDVWRAYVRRDLSPGYEPRLRAGPSGGPRRHGRPPGGQAPGPRAEGGRPFDRGGPRGAKTSEVPQRSPGGGRPLDRDSPRGAKPSEVPQRSPGGGRPFDRDSPRGAKPMDAPARGPGGGRPFDRDSPRGAKPMDAPARGPGGGRPFDRDSQRGPQPTDPPIRRGGSGRPFERAGPRGPEVSSAARPAEGDRAARPPPQGHRRRRR